VAALFSALESTTSPGYDLRDETLAVPAANQRPFLSHDREEVVVTKFGK
jgi:hypothetical protein